MEAKLFIGRKFYGILSHTYVKWPPNKRNCDYFVFKVAPKERISRWKVLSDRNKRTNRAN